MKTGHDFAEQAINPKYDKLTYKQYDCQAFVELVLYDTGVRKEGNKMYNWKGSNSMWRNALSWKGTKEECIAKFGYIPEGAWVFMLDYDGGEKERGYDDDQGNAHHVGIYVGNNNTRDSAGSRGGVGYRPLKDWNRVGLCKYLDYGENNKDNTNVDKILSIVTDMRNLIDELERMIL